MAKTPKIKRQWVKEEKRIVSLLYRKGLLKDFKITDFYWAEYHWFRSRKYKSKTISYDGKRYSYPIYLPEVHYCTTDYWGESDEHSIIGTILDHLHWGNIDDENWDPTSGEYPKSTFNWSMSRRQFIKYLEKLPTKVSDRKIDKLIRKQNREEY
jgi:hypothetical protein